jgi:chemotaxis protein methyltransferase CheR
MIESVTSIQLSLKEFNTLSGLIYDECGINLSKQKRVLLESRLRKRLTQLKFNSYAEYCNYVRSPIGRREELVPLIDAIVTNKTDFFREPVHFQFMREELLPSFAAANPSHSFKIWSTACSSGEEPYTLAMVMEEFALQQKMEYRITATDISTKALNKARTAIYPERAVTPIPMNIRKRYLLRSKDVHNPTIRIAPGLRSKIQFKRVNLIDEVLDVDYDFDLILCRNVLIYFDKVTQERVVNKMVTHLRSGGFLFIGHSESIHHMQLPLRQVRPTIFQKNDNIRGRVND